MKYRTASLFTAVSLAMAWSGAALAADPVTDAMQEAYAPYRVALFKTNAQAPAEARAAVDQALQAWVNLQQRFGQQPSAPYDRDPQFQSSLRAVETIYRKALVETDAGQLAQAHETLEAAREVMAELRHRNQIAVFSDAMNAYHAQMEQVLQQGPALLAQAQGRPALIAMTGALHYLARQLPAQASPALQAQAEFQAGLHSVQASVDALQQALWAGDDAAAQAALSKLKGPYSKFFLKFG